MKGLNPLIEDDLSNTIRFEVLPSGFKKPIANLLRTSAKTPSKNIRTSSLGLKTKVNKLFASKTTKITNKFTKMKENQYESEFYEDILQETPKTCFLPNIKTKNLSQVESAKTNNEEHINDNNTNESPIKQTPEKSVAISISEGRKSSSKLSTPVKPKRCFSLLDIMQPTYWHEIKPFGYKISRRSKHISFVYDDRLYIHGGIDFNFGVYNDMHCLVKTTETDESESYKWDTVVNGTDILYSKPSLIKLNTYNLKDRHFIDLASESVTEDDQIIENEFNCTAPYLARHAGCLFNDDLYIYGGRGSALKILNGQFTFNLPTKQWNFLNKQIKIELNNKKNRLPCIDSHTMNIHEGVCFIFGGFKGNKQMKYNNSSYKYDISNMEFSEQETLGERPIARANHGGSIVNGKLYIFGGCFEDQRLNDLWSLDLISLNWTCILENKLNIGDDRMFQGAVYPISREGHTMCSYKDRYILIFGGLHEITNEIADLFSFDTITSTWKMHEIEKKQNKSSQFDIFNNVGKFVSHGEEEQKSNTNEDTTRNNILNNITKKITMQNKSLDKIRKSYNYKIEQKEIIQNVTNYIASNPGSKAQGSDKHTEESVQSKSKTLNKIINIKDTKRSHSKNEKRSEIIAESKLGKFVISTPKSSSNRAIYNESSQIIIGKQGNELNVAKSVNFIEDNKMKASSRGILKSACLRHNRSSGTGVEVTQTNLIESMGEVFNKKVMNFKKRKAEEKINLLKEFDVRDKKLRDNQLDLSPVSKRLKNSLNYCGQYTLRDTNQSQATLIPYGQSVHEVSKGKNNRQIKNSKPCARDGHSMVILKDHIYIFGGDRHRMCFNDLYLRTMTDIYSENSKQINPSIIFKAT